jgi:H+-translocating diphosphatase
MEGHAKPDYASCVRISTNASLQKMVPAGFLVMSSPLVAGTFFGVEALAGLLAGALVSGVQVWCLFVSFYVFNCTCHPFSPQAP